MPEEFVNPFFKVQVLNHSGIEKANKLAAAFHNLFAEIAGIVGYESREYPVSYREFSLAKTHLELACFYAKKAMANNPKNQQTQMINKLSNVAKHSEPWDAAIADASKQIKALKRAVKVYKKHRDAGDEWPGFKRTVGTAKTVPGRAKAAATDSRDTAGMRGIL